MDIQNERELLIEKLVSKLPTFRQELGLSQAEFGKKVGLSRQSISSVERGAVPLSWSNYLSIIMFFNMNRWNERICIFLDENDKTIKTLLCEGQGA